MKFNIRKAMEYYQNLYNNYERQFPIHKNTVINHASSQEEQEDLKHYYNLCDHIEKQIIIHQNEMIQKVSMQKEMITHMKYGVGGLNLYRGYYNPSPILDLVVGNCSRGRLTKKYNVNVDDYLYGFDHDNNLIFVAGIYKKKLGDIELVEQIEYGQIGYKFSPGGEDFSGYDLTEGMNMDIDNGELARTAVAILEPITPMPKPRKKKV